MNVWDAIWTGVVAALVASAVWFAVFQFLRPRIRIAPEAAWDPGTGLTHIKIVNTSYRHAIDIRFQLDVLSPKVNPNGITFTRRGVTIASDPPLILARKRRGSDDANAYRVAAAVDPRDVFTGKKNQFVRFRVFARDSVSGVGRVVEATYDARGDFVDGIYEKGQGFRVEPR